MRDESLSVELSCSAEALVFQQLLQHTELTVLGKTQSLPRADGHVMNAPRGSV